MAWWLAAETGMGGGGRSCLFFTWCWFWSWGWRSVGAGVGVSTDDGDGTEALEVKTEAGDGCCGEVAVDDTIEGEVGTIDGVGTAALAAFELAFYLWEPGLLELLGGGLVVVRRGRVGFVLGIFALCYF